MHDVDDADIQAVVEVLKSDWLTTGPKVRELERVFAQTVQAKEAVAVSSGTAALHAAAYALGIGAGDEVIIPAMTFAASANCVVYQGGTPIFCDVDPSTLLIDPYQVEKLVTPRTKAIVAVDYAGQPCDYDALRKITQKYDLKLLVDACHALGGTYKKKSVGTLGDVNAFSFHPVKHVTAGEGGMVTTDDPVLARRMRIFRNHGITTDSHEREQKAAWFYEMQDLGFNYRLTDIQSALVLSQLTKLQHFVERRRRIAELYRESFRGFDWIEPLEIRDSVAHAYHLFVIRVDSKKSRLTRDKVFSLMRAQGIGVNVHYIPVHLHPFYQSRFGTKPGQCPVAEVAYNEILSLPMFPGMNDEDVRHVVAALRSATGRTKD